MGGAEPHPLLPAPIGVHHSTSGPTRAQKMLRQPSNKDSKPISRGVDCYAAMNRHPWKAGDECDKAPTTPRFSTLPCGRSVPSGTAATSTCGHGAPEMWRVRLRNWTFHLI